MTVVREIPMTVVPDVPHGTINGYGHHRCRCDECRRAKREYERERGYNVRVGKRGEGKRRADESLRLRHSCESCGAPCDRSAWMCWSCDVAARRAARDERRWEIQRRWLAGESLRQISAALGSTPTSIGAELVRMRRAGWNVPQRGPGGKVIEEGA